MGFPLKKKKKKAREKFAIRLYTEAMITYHQRPTRVFLRKSTMAGVAGPVSPCPGLWLANLDLLESYRSPPSRLWEHK